MTNGVMRNAFEQVAYERLFSTWDRKFVESVKGKEAIDEVLYRRQERAERLAVRWIDRHIPLADAVIVELGCGTGAASVPLARLCKRLVGLDIDAGSIDVARARASHYQVEKVLEFHVVAPDALLDKALTVEPAVNVVVLYAVLEHMTPSERLHYLQRIWRFLPAGGAIVVIETPNRLTWEDKHTAYMDFFHMLPDEFVVPYAERSPRPQFAETMRRITGPSFRESRYRWGLGASFHEFELAFEEKLAEIVVADGLETEMVQMFPVEPDELALRKYFIERAIPQPIGFSRAVLNLIFRKPCSVEERRRNVTYNERSLSALCGTEEASRRWLGRVKRFLANQQHRIRLAKELAHAQHLAAERYEVIQEMDRMLRERDERIAAMQDRPAVDAARFPVRDKEE